MKTFLRSGRGVLVLLTAYPPSPQRLWRAGCLFIPLVAGLLTVGGCTMARVGNARYISVLQNRDVTGLTFKQEGSNNASLKLEKSAVTGDAAMVDAAVRAAVAAGIAGAKSAIIP